MKYKHKIKTTLNVSVDVLAVKIEAYLTKKAYKITESSSGYISFTEDEFSDRKKSRSDFRTRIATGKFIFRRSANNETCLELIYLTSMTTYVVIVMLVCLFGIYTRNIIMPIVFAVFLTLPLLFKIVYQDEHVFKEIMGC